MNDKEFALPGYLKIGRESLKKRVKIAYELMEDCKICPRNCGINRLRGEKGYCRAGLEPEVSSFYCHMGEEPPLSGWAGSGAIFLTHCSLRCVFCQNYPISQLGYGKKITIERLAEIMLILQKRGCHNINFVTPTHFTPQILAAIDRAIDGGLKIPIVYNCGGYEKVETLKLLEGIVDIYLPDIKYGGEEEAKRYSNAQDYFEVAKKAVKEMYRQVGELKLSPDGIACKGLIIRHLVLPNDISKSEKVLKFIKEEISSETYVSIMNQYFPAYKALHLNELNRKVKKEEYRKVLNLARRLGLEKGWKQTVKEV